MTGKGAGQWTRLCAGALLAFAVLSAPVGAQDSGGGLPPQKVEDPAAVDPAPGVRADSTGALIPQVQRPPQDEDEPVSGGFQPQSGGAQAGGKAPSSGGGSSGALDYAGWERMAVRAENAIPTRSITNLELERLRLQLVDWREALLGAQNANAARIITLREQIDALGPAPEEGASEAEEIATRRKALSDQLVRLQAPGLAADEAYRRADGLIREIDRVLRERQANELLKLWPSPVNPANWADAAGALTLMAQTLWGESRAKWLDDRARRGLADNVPVILPMLLFALAILWRGRRWTDRVLAMLAGPASIRGRRIWQMLGSLALIIVPTLGFVALAEALVRSQMLGPVGTALAESLGAIGLMTFAAVWLGGRAFPVAEGATGILTVSADRRAAGRFLTSAFGVLLAIALVLRVAMDPLEISDAAKAVLRLPVIVVGSLILLRVGQLIRASVDAEPAEEGAGVYRQRLIGLLARAAIAIGLIGPLLAAVGYISAAAALVFPAALSLGLAALLHLAQRLVSDLYALVTGAEGSDQDALVPVLISFALTLCTLPLFALIWGARVADLTELWTRFQEGFALGGSRISPTDFLFFAVVFGFGYSLTRLFQGAMKSSILPRTGMDQGGQNALVSGLGYVGIFISALVAIRATGIDLSGLAIVAGALSVGIGFGLQTVVSNFVSGIILLIERPISEGDWIEVGPVQGIVASISVRSTRIQTFDRSDVIVPNSDLISQRVTNWTRFSLTGRLIVPVAVPYTSDSRKVERVLRQIAEAQPLALLSPPPIVALINLTGETMNFEIRVILRDVNFLVEVRSEINHQIARRFAEEGIVFTNAHRDYLKRLEDEAAAAAEAEAEWQAHQEAVADLLAPPQGKELTPR
jgi:small-conductance mechanosensitive channel